MDGERAAEPREPRGRGLRAIGLGVALGAIALTVGVALGLAQPLFFVALVPVIAGGFSSVGLVLLACIGAFVLLGVIALVSRRARGGAALTCALAATLAGGIVAGNGLASRLQVGFATPKPAATAHPTGPGWAATGDLLAARAGHVAILLRDGRVLVAGGTALSPDRHVSLELTSAELYDPASGVWTATGRLTVGRASAVATRLADGRVLIIDRRAWAEIWDPATGRWSTTAEMPTNRTGYAVTALRDGRLLLSGGTSEGGWPASLLYDPAGDAWTTTGPMVAPRAWHVAAVLPDGRVLVAGGQGTEQTDANPMGLITAAEIFDPATRRWTATEPMHARHTTVAAVGLADGRVIVLGGLPPNSGVEAFDPRTGRWSPLGSIESWMNPAAALIPDGRVLIASGFGNVEILDPATGVASPMVSSGHGSGATTTVLADGRVLVAGGQLLAYPGPGTYLAGADLYTAP